jgi:hypothetical protein
MPAKKGTRPPAAGVARRKGIPNKITRDMRELISAFVENNLENAQSLYDRVARHHPYRALTILNRFAEFVCPKMNRVEITATTAPIDAPIASVADAARVYELLMRDRTIDVSKITYAGSVVAEQGRAP